jgi:hypothetical protein
MLAPFAILVCLSCATRIEAPVAAHLWPDDDASVGCPELRLALDDRSRPAPLRRAGALTKLAGAGPLRLVPGLHLRLGTISQSRFAVVPPLSSAQLWMSRFRSIPRGGLTLLF